MNPKEDDKDKERDKKILAVVAADNSRFSESAFRKSLRVLAAKDTVFHLVHVRPSEDAELLDTFSDALKEYQDKIERRRKEQAQGILEKFKEIADEAGVRHVEVELTCRPEFYMPAGDPRAELCMYCADVGADILVLGSRGLGPAGRLAMGSVSVYCMSHAPCTVLVDHGQSVDGPPKSGGGQGGEGEGKDVVPREEGNMEAKA